MEMKPGYRQTEVGVIPEEWESTTICGIAASARNAIVGGPFGSDLVSNDYVEEGVPVIRGQNMGEPRPQTEEVGVASVMLDEPTSTVFSGFVLRARPKNARLSESILLWRVERAEANCCQGVLHNSGSNQWQNTFGSGYPFAIA